MVFVVAVFLYAAGHSDKFCTSMGEAKRTALQDSISSMLLCRISMPRFMPAKYRTLAMPVPHEIVTDGASVAQEAKSALALLR